MYDTQNFDTHNLSFSVLTYFTKHNTLQVHTCCCKWQRKAFFLTEQQSIIYIICGIYHICDRILLSHKEEYHIYTTSPLSICCWTFRLLPCLGYCKQCCYERWSAYILLNQCFHFLWPCTQEWNKQMNVTKHKQTHRYREQTSGYQWAGRTGRITIEN